MACKLTHKIYPLFMKNLIIVISAFAIPITIIKTANAQSFVQKVEETATIPEKETAAGQKIDAILEAIKAEIVKSFDQMGGTPIPVEEKLKKFDETLQDLRAVLDLVSEEGELGKLMDECYNLNIEHLDKFKNESSNKSFTQSQREFCKKQIPRYESTLQQINAKKLEIKKVRNEISTAKKELEGAKLEFIDALSVDDLEWQNKCLEKLKSSRELLDKTLWLLKTNSESQPDKAQKKESARSTINASSQNQLTSLINLTNEQSEFDNLLNESYKLNKARLNEWKVKANDKSLNFNQRAFYEKQIPRYEAAVEGIFKMRLSMLQANHFLSHPNTTIKSPDQNSTSNCYPASEKSTSEIASSNFDEFNNVLQKFENAISLVDKHEKLLDNEFQTKKTMLDEFKKLASDISLSQKEHDSYQKKIMTCESEIQKVNEDRLKLIRTKKDLLKAKKDIENSKQFYGDAIIMQELETLVEQND